MFITDCLAYRAIQTSVSDLPFSKECVSIKIDQEEGGTAIALTFNQQQAKELAMQLFGYLIENSNQRKDDNNASNLFPVPRWTNDSDSELPRPLSA